MNYAEQAPSKQWLALKSAGETVAAVWFKPDGEPFSLAFRISQRSFQLPGMAPRLTAANLLKAVGIAAQAVESWRHDGGAGSDLTEATAELGQPLPPPAPDVTHLNLYLRLKPRAQEGAASDRAVPEVPEAQWQELEARWNAVVSLEGRIEAQRMSMESLRTELEGWSRRTLSTDEKIHALSADLAQWNKVKGRVPHAVPKVKEFIHRATWAAGTPERKKLDEIYKNHIRPRVAIAAMDQLLEQIEGLFKDRQILSGQGVTVCQEGKGICAEVQAVLRTLQNNAATNAARKRGATVARGKTSARGKAF